MKFLRHYSMVFWTVVSSLLIIVLVTGIFIGKHYVYSPNTPVQYDNMTETAIVMAFRTRLMGLESIVVPPNEYKIPSWAKKTATLANEAAAHRAGIAGQNDPLAKAYRRLAVDSTKLEFVNLSNHTQVLADVTRVMYDGDRLAALVRGASPTFLG